MSSYRVPAVFMGSDPIALPVLSYLHTREDIKLTAIFTQPDKPSGRGQKLQSNPIKNWAIESHIPLFQPERSMGEVEVNWMRAHRVQIAFVMAFGQLLKQPVLDFFSLGAWNFHPSLLPQYRGPCPIEAALLEGDSMSGVTLMQMILKMDAGAIVDLEPLAIDPLETTESFRQKAAQACIPLIKRQCTGLLKGSVPLTPQDESQVSYVRKLEKQDGYLNFEQTAQSLAWQVRALKTWPGSFFEYENLILKVGAAHAIEGSGPAGLLLSASKEGIKIGTKEGILVVTQIQRPASKMLSVGEFLRGFPLELGVKVKAAPLRCPIVKKSC